MASASASAPAPKSASALMVLQMVAGAGAGAVAKTATAPLERVKIIFQVQVREAAAAAAAPGSRDAPPAIAHPPPPPPTQTLPPPRAPYPQGMQGADLVAPKYTGIVQAFRTVVREEGVWALWKGNLANVLRVIPVYGLKFAFNDSIKAFVAGPSKRRLDAGDLLWVGTLAGLMQTALTYPLETVRTRLTLGPEQGVRYAGIADCFRQMARTEGVAGLCVGGAAAAMAAARALACPLARARARKRFAGPQRRSPPTSLLRPPSSFKGFGPTLVSGAPYTGIQMTSYELLKRAGPDGGDGVLWQLTAGAASGLLAQTVTYPGDTVRRRMQNNGAGGAARVYRNSFHCASEIWVKEGAGGFFRGALTNTVRAVPGAAFQFAAYEGFKTLLGC